MQQESTIKGSGQGAGIVLFPARAAREETESNRNARAIGHWHQGKENDGEWKVERDNQTHSESD